VFVQTNGWGGASIAWTYRWIAFSGSRVLRRTARRIRFSAQAANQRSTTLIHDERVGVKCR
jgi:hypothetical protein